VASLFSMTIKATCDDDEVGRSGAGGSASGLPGSDPPHAAIDRTAAPTAAIQRGREVRTPQSCPINAAASRARSAARRCGRPGGADATVPLSRGLPSGSRGRRRTPRQRGQQATPPASPERPAPLPAVLFARRARSDQLEVQGGVVDQPAHRGDPAAVISTAAPRTDPLRERLPAEARHDRVPEHDVRAVARMLEAPFLRDRSRGRRPRTDRRAIARPAVG
jgi:hypothetical protein